MSLPVLPGEDGRFVKVSLPDGEVAVELPPRWVQVSQENYDSYLRLAAAMGESCDSLDGWANDGLRAVMLRPSAYWCAGCGLDREHEVHRGIRGVYAP